MHIGTLIDLYMNGDGDWHGARAEYPTSPGSRTSEADNMHYALRDLRAAVIHNLPIGDPLATRTGRHAASRHVEDLGPDEFRPHDLRAVQRHMIKIGLCRNEVNKRKNKILRFFRWCVSYGHAEQVTLDRLETVTPVKPHHPGVRETEEVTAPPPEAIDKVLACSSPILIRAIGVQLAAALRPGELVPMKICELHPHPKHRDLWEYRPLHHKTKHKRVKRIIPLKPDAQILLNEVVAWRFGQGEFDFTPGSGGDHRVRMPRLGDSGDTRRIWPWRTVSGYYQAIRGAAGRAGVRLAPNQLRHFTLSDAAARCGELAAAQLAGHTDPRTTRRHYIEPDRSAAEQYVLGDWKDDEHSRETQR